jgi:peptide/nickel transport system substrate-binding protein
MSGESDKLDEIVRLLAPRANRRDVLRGAGGVTAAALLSRLQAAGASAAPAAQDVKQGGTLVSMVVAEPTSMDIASGTGQHNYAVMSNVFENLLQYDATGFEAKPALAESYEVSADGMVYTFKLREGVIFHDGTPMNAEAVKFSYQRVMDPNNEYYKVGAPFPLIDFWYEAIDPNGIVVNGDYSVTFNLKKPHSTLDAFLAWPAAVIVSPTAVAQYREQFRENPVGTGPFKFVSWEHNKQVTFERFDEYWGGPAPLDGLVFRPIIEEPTRLTELLAGNIDFAYDLPPDNVAQVRDNANFTFYQTPLGHVWFLVTNTQAGPTANRTVRQAIAHAIDKDSIIKDILQDTGVPATGPIPQSIEYAYTDQVPQYPYDPEKAIALLAEAGFPDGFETRFWVPQSGSGMQSSKTMGEAIQANLSEVGIIANIEVFEWGAYIDQYAKGLPDDVGLAECSWFTTDARNIPNLTLTCKTVSPAGYNAGRFCNEEVDALIEQFTNTLDRGQQAEIMAKLQEIVATEVPNIYIDTQLGTGALAKKYAGFNFHPSQLLRFYTTHLA